MKLGESPIYTECFDGSTYVLKRLEPNPVSKVLINSIRPMRIQVQNVLTLSMKHISKYQSNVSSTTTSMIDVIRDEPVILARLGFVVSCGLGGYILGYKGHSVRKLVYASLGSSVATLVCFPNASLSNVKCAIDLISKKFSEMTKK
ncbi:unnamed protein product [Schistosoma turkestanicum]|nr:unnamed protein product [Schistosoma turkestanicum]